MSVFHLGGGIQGDEDLARARRREVCEETGCELVGAVKLGIITEDRKGGDLFQISHYVALEVPNGNPKFSPEEKMEGFLLYWADDMEDAIRLVGGNSSEIYDDKYIRMRDSTILVVAKQYLGNQG